jgi:hypothetical protein
MDKIEDKLWERVEKYRWVFGIVPFVKLVSVCNNLSFGVVDENSDIDIFIVTRKDRIFIVWAIMNLLMKVLGIRTYGEDTAGKFCLSFMVDEKAMRLSQIALKNDVYLAYWIHKLIPILNRNCLPEFEAKNNWISSHLGVSPLRVDRTHLKAPSLLQNIVRSFIGVFFLGPLGSLFEWIAQKFAVKGLKSRPGVRVSPRMIKLHEDDKRMRFRDAYSYKTGFEENKFLSVIQSFRGK